MPSKAKIRTKAATAASQARSHEEKSKASKKTISHRDSNELHASLAKARESSQAHRHEEKSRAAKKAADTKK